MFYAASWPVPPGLRPATAALAVTLASGTFGRLGGGIAAAAVMFTPLPLPVRLALVVVALVGGELRHRTLMAGRAMAVRSFTDRLTGLRNYDFFCEALASELARSADMADAPPWCCSISTGSRPSTTVTATRPGIALSARWDA